MATVLITGANRGIGLALVAEFLSRGDAVIATARAIDAAAELQALAAQPGAKLDLIAMDVTDAASIRAAKAAIGERGIDILINNAGIIGPKRQSTTDMDFDGWAETFAVNTMAPLRVIQAFLPNLLAVAPARILTISSRMGSLSHASADRIAYRSSKAAVNKVSQALATDLKPQGIAVAVAHPGWVRSSMGGSGADISEEVSAAGLARVIDRMSLRESPSFYNYDGAIIPW